MSKLVLAVPSKGRLMEQTTEMFARAGLIVRKVGHARGYRGEIDDLDGTAKTSLLIWCLRRPRAKAARCGLPRRPLAHRT